MYIRKHTVTSESSCKQSLKCMQLSQIKWPVQLNDLFSIKLRSPQSFNDMQNYNLNNLYIYTRVRMSVSLCICRFKHIFLLCFGFSLVSDHCWLLQAVSTTPCSARSRPCADFHRITVRMSQQPRWHRGLKLRPVCGQEPRWNVFAQIITVWFGKPVKSQHYCLEEIRDCEQGGIFMWPI